jgi:hypothetical protein
MEDIVQFDTASVAGIRQQFSDNSILEISSVSTPLFAPIQVWADPYVVGEDRIETDRISRGARIEYDKILGTGFGIQYTQRETEIDDELSGTTQLTLTPEEIQLLDREGDVTRIAAYYRFKPIGRNILEVRLSRRSDDLNGDAMAGEQDQLQITNAYIGQRYIVATNVFYSQQDYDAVNPVFGRKRESDTLGLGFVVFDQQLFNSKNWFGQASLVWVEKDSNIDFYDVGSTMVSLGAQYRF